MEGGATIREGALIRRNMVGVFRRKFNKRAMMALDCSPESFSPQNEFYLPIVPTCFDTRGIHMITVDKGSQGDAKYQIPKASSFREEEF